MSVSPVAAGLFDKRHNPMWTIQPSHARDQGPARRSGGRPAQTARSVYDFTDPEWNTRFLGDLYQDLSEAARKTYALLQTPEFVEEFILKYTLDPAIEEFGLEPAPPVGHEDLPHRLRVIDPACGSGHFLLGAFRRLLTAWETETPSDRQVRAGRQGPVVRPRRGQEPVRGGDRPLPPDARRDARGGRGAPDGAASTSRSTSPSATRLLHGKGAPGQPGRVRLRRRDRRTHLPHRGRRRLHQVLSTSWSTAPTTWWSPTRPYITVKDKAENENYRKAYESCSGKYALSVPFAERIFQLADPRTSGYTGQITANSFMKREFGKKLIEEFFPRVDLTHVIDTSGAYHPWTRHSNRDPLRSSPISLGPTRLSALSSAFVANPTQPEDPRRAGLAGDRRAGRPAWQRERVGKRRRSCRDRISRSIHGA